MESPATTRPSALDTQAIAELSDLLGERFTVGLALREQHSFGESYHPAALPDAVCFPRSTEEVSAIIRISQRYQIPVVPFGAGTSVEGGVNAISGGISIDLREMHKILRVSVPDMDATVEAGVTRLQFSRYLKDTGLTFFIDPGADATIGGMTATRASGTTAVRYGTMSENVLGLTVVLADGRVIHTGTRARKSSAGYDLTHLFVGSEGTLGIITEVILRLHPYPEAVCAAVCTFGSIEGAVQTAIGAIQLGLKPARIELLDEKQIEAVNRFSHTDLTVLPTLFFEFHGMNDREVMEHAAALQEIAEEYGGREFQRKTSLEDRDALWKARHDAYHATHALVPGCAIWSTDVCVPISRLAECIVETKKDLLNVSVPTTIVGHVGDGNFHVLCAIDPNKPEEYKEILRFSDALVGRALAMGGTCTGEHGIGYGKMKYLEQEHGDALDVMRSIKAALDPDNRMNPGKIVIANPSATARDPIATKSV